MKNNILDIAVHLIGIIVFSCIIIGIINLIVMVCK